MRDVTANITLDSPADVVGILDDMNALAPKAPGPRCGVSVALERIAAADAEVGAAVRERVVDETYPASGVAAILTARTSVNVSAYTLRRHRKRGTADGCRCAR